MQTNKSAPAAGGGVSALARVFRRFFLPYQPT